jgi:uncharacterized protein YciU (UPF0263 family)
MNNSNHLKKIKILVQFSDGSSSNLVCYSDKKEFLVEFDIKSNIIWKTSLGIVNSTQDNNKNKFYSNYKKLFKKFK